MFRGEQMEPVVPFLAAAALLGAIVVAVVLAICFGALHRE